MKKAGSARLSRGTRDWGESIEGMKEENKSKDGKEKGKLD